MELQRQVQLPAAPGDGGGPENNDLDEVRADVAGILDAADRILDGIRPLNAEDYLQQNRQRGGE
jgi:hypothetical protein